MELFFGPRIFLPFFCSSVTHQIPGGTNSGKVYVGKLEPLRRFESKACKDRRPFHSKASLFSVWGMARARDARRGHCSELRESNGILLAKGNTFEVPTNYAD